MRTKLLAALVLLCLVSSGCKKAVKLDDLGQVPEWTATDQNGAVVGSATLAGKPYAVNFMFTSCPSSCPPLAKASGDLQTRIEAWRADSASGASIVTITIDPENDTPEKLAVFAETYGADPAIWQMARLRSYTQMETLVTRGFYLPIMRRDVLKARSAQERLALLKEPTPLDTAHSVQFMLIDAEGHIRGRFGKTDPELDRLNDALKQLANP